MAAPKRIRRTPEEARRVILDAAEKTMAATGPAGLRLQDVAAAAGVSHPLVLHHFGSREGLIHALNRRTVEDLKTVLVGVIRKGDSSGNAVAMTFAAYRGGLAQRMAWLLQTQSEIPGTGMPFFEEVVETLHAMRQDLAGPGVEIDRFDSRAIAHLTTIAAFGDAIIGPRLRQASDEAGETQLRRRFEDWFGEMLNLYVSARRT